MSTHLRLCLGVMALAATLGGPALAQDRPREVRESAAPPGAGNLDQRLARLETQVAQLLKEIQSLRAELKSAARPEDTELRVIPLRNAEATEVARILSELFQGPGKSLRIATDSRTNSVLVQARPDHLRAIEAVIIRLDEPDGRPGGKK